MSVRASSAVSGAASAPTRRGWVRASGEDGPDGAARLLREEPHHAHRGSLVEDREQDGLLVHRGDVDALRTPWWKSTENSVSPSSSAMAPVERERPRGEGADGHRVEGRALAGGGQELTAPIDEQGLRGARLLEEAPEHLPSMRVASFSWMTRS